MNPRLSLLVLVLGACAGESRFGRHFDGSYWVEGLAQQTRKPDQLLIELALLETTIGLAPFDHELQEEATENQTLTEGSTANGDGTAIGLSALAGGLAAGEWIDGDDARSLEVLLESFAVTEGLTQLLKVTVRRERPAKDSNSSFPSGHSSYSFMLATYLQRRISDLVDGWAGDLGYLAYLPAAYVAIDRVEADRHWPTDVAFGAFLGVFLTNVVYDAHYGAPGRPGIFGVRGLGVEPDAAAGGAGISFVLRF